MIKKIGSGAFGTVFLIRKKNSSKLFALKRLNKDTFRDN
jgi:serine/threonine protein kinase